MLALNDVLAVPADVRQFFDPRTFTIYQMKPERIVVVSNEDDAPYELYTTIDTVRHSPELIRSMLATRDTRDVCKDACRDVWGMRHGAMTPLAFDMASASPFPVRTAVATYSEDNLSRPLHVTQRTIVCH